MRTTQARFAPNRQGKPLSRHLFSTGMPVFLLIPTATLPAGNLLVSFRRGSNRMQWEFWSQIEIYAKRNIITQTVIAGITIGGPFLRRKVVQQQGQSIPDDQMIAMPANDHQSARKRPAGQLSDRNVPGKSSAARQRFDPG
jgi:hypothetical protein